MRQNWESAEASLPYMKTSPKAIFFTDFDGTITLDDCNDHLVDNFGFGVEKRRILELEVLKGNMTFRDVFQAMLDSVHLPFDECLRIIQENVRLDPHFLEF
ncbi:unnamed protein product [Penicillium salamii]|nr:unnamed protein product [Penicillium salamii]CAG8241705.1 unnamed protein product [Penicillium salamii]CAG8402788.1 unnamed protein product [Penicillium salamii]